MSLVTGAFSGPSGAASALQGSLFVVHWEVAPASQPAEPTNVMQGTCLAGSKAGSTKGDTPRGNADDALLSPEDYSNVEAFIGAFEVLRMMIHGCSMAAGPSEHSHTFGLPNVTLHLADSHIRLCCDVGTC